MRIGIIGGADKNHARYHELARATGCGVEFHDGYMDGRATDALHSLIARCDVVVIVTRVNSHTAVRLARGAARRNGRTVLIVRRFGLKHFQEMIEAYAHGAPAQLAS